MTNPRISRSNPNARIVALIFAVAAVGAGVVRAQAAGSPTTTRPATVAAPTTGPDALFGLRPTAAPKTITFEQALGMAAVNSWDLRAIGERVEQQDAQLRRAWSVILPQLSAGASYQYSFPEQKVNFGSEEQNQQQALLFRSLGGIVEQSARANPDPAARAAASEQAQQLLTAAEELENAEPLEIEIAPAHVGNANITINIPLFNGRAIPGIQNALQAVDLARASAAQAKSGVLLGVARAYFGAWTAQRFITIAEAQLASTVAHRELTKTQTDAGVLTPLALQRAELDVVRAEQSLRAARQTAGQARAGLGLVLGVSEDFQIAAPPTVPALERGVGVDALVARALASRKDLAVQRMALDIANRGTTDAWMQYLPTLALQGQGRYTTNTGGFTSDPFTGAIIVQASIPLYDGGNRYAAMQESTSRVREETFKLKQLEEKIESQVRGNAEDLRIRGEALQTAQHAVELSKASRDNAVRFYELGTATNLDVIDANLALFGAELDLARAQLDVDQGRLGLAYILGELAPAP